MQVKSTQNISMIQFLNLLRKHIKTILGTMVLMTATAIFVTFFVMTPKYSATTDILVNRKLSANLQSAQFQQVQADVQMISTYKDIITSPTVLKDVDQKVKNDPGYPGSIESLKKSLSINNSQNSQVFSVTAKANNAETAAAIANQTAEVFKKKIGKIMSIDNVSIVSQAEKNSDPVSPNKKINIIAGLVIGLMLGVVIALVRELTDRTVEDESFLTEELGLTSLGLVNEIDQKDIEKTVEHKRLRIKVGNGEIKSRGEVRRV